MIWRFCERNVLGSLIQLNLSRYGMGQRWGIRHSSLAHRDGRNADGRVDDHTPFQIVFR
jgi:hypothetical protein